MRSFSIVRVIAALEVLIAFVCMHLAFRAIGRFTAFGQWEAEVGAVFRPGLCMIVVSLAMILLQTRTQRRRLSLAAYGITLRPFSLSLGSGWLCVLILSVIGRALASAGLPLDKAKDDWLVALAVGLASLLATWVVFWSLRKIPGGLFARVRTASAICSSVSLSLPCSGLFSNSDPSNENC